MTHTTSEAENVERGRRRLTNAVKDSLRDVRRQLSIFGRQVGVRLDLKYVDMDCLDLINRHDPLSPTVLARYAGLHPATMTGVLDRLERAGWIVRERRSPDRRAVVVRALHDRFGDVYGVLAGMSTSMDEICAGYSDSELEVITDFLRRTADAGRDAMNELTE